MIACNMTAGSNSNFARALPKFHAVSGNCVCPGRIHTPFVDGYLQKHYPGRETEIYKKLCDWHPMARMGCPEEVAALILYLVSDEAGFVTGAAYPIDGGRSCL